MKRIFNTNYSNNSICLRFHNNLNRMHETSYKLIKEPIRLSINDSIMSALELSLVDSTKRLILLSLETQQST